MKFVLIVLQVGTGVRVSTKVVDKTVAPVWNETFAFLAPAGNTKVDLIMEDQDVLSNDFLGKVTVTAQDFRCVCVCVCVCVFVFVCSL